MTTLPAITTFSDAAVTSASAVYANDVALAGAFGALEMSDSISNDNSPIMIGPIRIPILSSSTVALYKWIAPVDVELWELHVSPVAALDGTTDGSTLSGSAYASIGVYKSDADGSNSEHIGSFLLPQSLTTSYTKDLSGESDRVVDSGDLITIQTASNGAASPKYLASISLLAYTKHRE